MENDKKEKTITKTSTIIYNIISILCIIICIIARLTNPGFILLPFIFIWPFYATAFFISNFFLIRDFKKTRRAKIIYILSCLTIVIACICIPDIYEIKNYIAYKTCFFGLIKGENPLCDVFYTIGMCAALTHLITIIVAYISRKNNQIKMRE